MSPSTFSNAPHVSWIVGKRFHFRVVIHIDADFSALQPFLIVEIAEAHTVFWLEIVGILDVFHIHSRDTVVLLTVIDTILPIHGDDDVT